MKTKNPIPEKFTDRILKAHACQTGVGTGQSATEVVESEIGRSVGSLQHIAGGIRETVCALEKRLHPVMTWQPKTDGHKISEPPQTGCDMVDALEEIRYAIELAQSDLNEVMNRLAL